MIDTWYLVEHIQIASLQEGIITEAVAGSKTICLLKRNGTIYAFAATCPHAGANMCDGWVDTQGRVVCALHKYRYDPANGRNTTGEGYKLYTYKTKMEGSSIYVAYM
jgi:3-phenylpropionate/trans-cinnamate dioxygenase ferredoxin subunit